MPPSSKPPIDARSTVNLTIAAVVSLVIGAVAVGWNAQEILSDMRRELAETRRLLTNVRIWTVRDATLWCERAMAMNPGFICPDPLAVKTITFGRADDDRLRPDSPAPLPTVRQPLRRLPQSP